MEIKHSLHFNETALRNRLRECYNLPAEYKGRKVISTIFTNNLQGGFYIIYIKAENAAYIKNEGEILKTFTGTPIMLYTDIMQFIDENINFV